MVEKIIEKIKSEILIQKNYIHIRAEQYKESTLSESEIDNLFNIDCDGEIVKDYDTESLEAHNFDLGKLIGLKEILVYILIQNKKK